MIRVTFQRRLEALDRAKLAAAVELRLARVRSVVCLGLSATTPLR